jgi:hypothetical protein
MLDRLECFGGFTAQIAELQDRSAKKGGARRQGK